MLQLPLKGVRNLRPSEDKEDLPERVVFVASELSAEDLLYLFPCDVRLHGVLFGHRR